MPVKELSGSRRLPVGWILVALGAAIGLEASTFNVAFLTDPVGPKALPLVAALILIAAGLRGGSRERAREQPGVGSDWEGLAAGEGLATEEGPATEEELATEEGLATHGEGAPLKIALAGLAFVAYAWLLPSLGFFLSTTAAVATLSRLYGAPLRRAVLAAGGLSAVLWLLFVRLLALPLPIGSLWIR